MTAMSFSLDVASRCCLVLRSRHIDSASFVEKFTAAAPLRKAQLTARCARITHAASPMLGPLTSTPAMIVVSFRPGEV
jgi:hypothetical protein